MAKPMADSVKRRVIALLTREEIEFLDQLSLDAQFTIGNKLTRVDIVAALIDAAKEIGVSGKDVHDQKAFKDRILKTAGEYQERRSYPRLRVPFKVHLRALDGPEDVTVCKSENVSFGGIGVNLSDVSPTPGIDQVIEVQLEDPADPQCVLKA